MEKVPRFNLETAFAAFLCAAGAGIAWASWGYGFGTLARPGPGLYPFFLGIAIALASILILISHVGRAQAVRAFEPGKRATFLLMVAIFCLWIVAMPLLGYVAVTLAATFAFCKVLDLEGWAKPLAVAGATALFIYLLFGHWLYIDLPRGIFG